MPVCGGDEIGLEADGVEDGVGREEPRDVLPPGGRAVDGGERAADERRKSRVSDSLAQPLLPYRVQRRVEILHDEGVLAAKQHLRHGTGRGLLRDAKPFVLVAVARHGRFPELRDAQPWQRALDADRAACQFHAPDVRRDPAAERFGARVLVGAAQPAAAQELDDAGIHGLSRCMFERSQMPRSPKPMPEATMAGAYPSAATAKPMAATPPA